MKGQVWIETVLYTLIALALMGLVLTFVMPKINEGKDKAVVEQTIASLNELDKTMSAVMSSAENSRIIYFSLRRGEFYINSTDDSLSIVISDLGKPYSQENKSLEVGRVNVLTEKKQKNYVVHLTLNYWGDVNITYANEDKLRKLTSASVPYELKVRNLGQTSGDLNTIDIESISGR